MPVIARLLWVLVVVLAVLAVYTSVVQNEDLADTDRAPATQQTADNRNADYAHKTPVADDPPIPQGGTYRGNTMQDGQTASGAASLADVLATLDNAIPMSVDKAYESIPHKRTTYSASGARISRTEGEYLEQLFALTDQMTAARVAALTQLYYGRGGMSVEAYNSAYDTAMDGFNMLQPPSAAAKAHEQIVTAISEQHTFINHWGSSGGAQNEQMKKSYGRHGLVQSSHKRLLAAYGILMRAYGHDSAHNKTSFYDHLCALDFI